MKHIKHVAGVINDTLSHFKYSINVKSPIGKPATHNKNIREFRVCPVEIDAKLCVNTSIEILSSRGFVNVQYNRQSCCSSKYPSLSFSYSNTVFETVITKGKNRGERFEQQTLDMLTQVISNTHNAPLYNNLLASLEKSHTDFNTSDIVSISGRSGSTRRGNDITQSASIIGDIIIRDSSERDWFISLKDINGSSFATYPGGHTLFSNDELVYNSPASNFLYSFGADLNLVQRGFDIRNNITKIRTRHTVPQQANNDFVRNVFQRAWGINYFYARRKSDVNWETFWLCENTHQQLTDVTVDRIKYPDINTKSITIYCSSSFKKYVIEVRNSRGGEYPCNITFKIR